jgi:hypothetical protein
LIQQSSKYRHKWSEAAWFENTRLVLINSVFKGKVTEEEVAIAILMLYPAKGPSSGKDPVKSSNPQSRVYWAIGEEGMVVFKKFITENNNKGLREIYFSHPFIRRLWPTLIPHMTADLVFKTGLPSKEAIGILPSFYLINYEMLMRNLPMPPWYQEMFPIDLDWLQGSSHPSSMACENDSNEL